MKIYTIFAGVNGAGKTSIYESIYYTENKEEKRINADEMVALILVYFLYLGSVRQLCDKQVIKIARHIGNSKVSSYFYVNYFAIY